MAKNVLPKSTVKIIIIIQYNLKHRLTHTCLWEHVGLRNVRSETRRNLDDLRWRPSAMRFCRRNPTVSYPFHSIGV